jgi:tRNASer (uridine44-2'-O)-methyltransferase
MASIIRLESSHDARPEEMVSTPQPSNNGFHPTDLTSAPPIFQLPDEIWLSIFSTPCTFNSTYFLQVIENTLKNPNVTTSCVFRADIFYDSLNDVKILGKEGLDEGFIKHMKPELRPKKAEVAGFEHQRTIVRNMVPRNPQLDKALVQTCHIFRHKSEDGKGEKYVLLMIPHISTPDEIPFYHPSVQSLALLHSWDEEKGMGDMSVHYRMFPGVEMNLDNRLQRTALNFLKVIHKHGVGQQAGYTKRVFHDQIVPQSKFQDTYTRLKIKYAKILIGDWVEQTDPTKHVFEDLGIAAFLMELWEQMYGIVTTSGKTSNPDIVPENTPKKLFPGFVDIGCGNGVLVNVLNQEGYPGWGFDARRRKTWSTFSPSIQAKLKELLLVPQILQHCLQASNEEVLHDDSRHHNGIFPQGTFILSNHADELTTWTPLLAYQNKSPFIAIPCCSHNLAGTRIRFNDREAPFADPAIPVPETEIRKTKNPLSAARLKENILAMKREPAPTSSGNAVLAPRTSEKQNGLKPPSAYQSLTFYTARLATECGFLAEKEMLRIPSTRNAAIVGRDSKSENDEDDEERREKVGRIVRREVGDLKVVAKEWMERAMVIAGAKGGAGGH